MNLEKENADGEEKSYDMYGLVLVDVFQDLVSEVCLGPVEIHISGRLDVTSVWSIQEIY